MKAYSQDLRERALRAVDDGYPRAEIVQMFGIFLSTLKRYVKQRRDCGWSYFWRKFYPAVTIAFALALLDHLSQ